MRRLRQIRPSVSLLPMNRPGVKLPIRSASTQVRGAVDHPDSNKEVKEEEIKTGFEDEGND